jgi:histidyl-tRNA synthetase
MGLKYSINNRLVRGLDYYTHTCFEFISPMLGAQSAVLAGGRYDDLVHSMGGGVVPGSGYANENASCRAVLICRWALGVERALMLLNYEKAATPHVAAILPILEESKEGMLECFSNTNTPHTFRLTRHSSGKFCVMPSTSC